MSIPKVLILNQPFNNYSGGGITLSNLFAGWNEDKLAVICTGHFLSNNNIDTQICNTYYQIGHKERKWIFPLKYFNRKYFSGPMKFDEKRIQNLPLIKSKVRIKLIMDYMYPFFEYMGLFHCLSKIKLSPELCSWLDDYNPDVVYAQAQSREEVLFCLEIYSYLKKPLIFHMMDDWPSASGKKGLFKTFWYKKIDKEFRLLLDKANILMSISDYMAKEYLSRYGKNFTTFHNPINIEFWKKYQKTNYDLNSTPTILYAGRVGLGIDASLQLIANAIGVVNKTLEISIKFVLQTPEKPIWIKNYKNILHSSFVDYDCLPKVFSESDLLVLAYDFSEESISFIRYSMPTKASEYMASGTPIIVFAPDVTAIANYAQTYHWAKVITENNIGYLSAAIMELIQNKNAREKLSKNAIQIAEKNHNSIDVTNQFKELICSLVDSSNNN